MRRSQIAINSVSATGELEELLDAFGSAGFRNVEFMLGHVKDYLAKGQKLPDVRRLLDTHKLQCIGGFQCPLECFSSPARRRANHNLIVENAHLLAELGATTMVVGTDGPEDPFSAKDPLGQMAKVFAQVARRIRATGITMCIEFNWSPIVKSLRTAAEIARRSRADNVGVLFDPAHYHCTPTKFDQLTPDNIGQIKHVHVDDMADKPAELSNCNADRRLPGEGCLDLKALLGRIERCGYKGHFSIEMFSDKLWALPAHKAAKIMYKSMLTLCRR